jgi:hypothetical protein
MAEHNNDQKSASAEAGGQYPGPPVRPAPSGASDTAPPSIPSVDDEDSTVSDYCKGRSEAKKQILTHNFQADTDSAVDGLSDMCVLGQGAKACN